MKRLLAALLLVTFCLSGVLAEDGLSLDQLVSEIDKEAKALTVAPVTFEISPDRQSIFLNRPEVRGSDSYTIAYNIYDANSNPVNYFYSLEDRVAATPGYGGLFNVFVVVTDAATGAQETQNIGWQTLAWPYAERLTVGRAAYEISPDRRSVFLTRPEIACRGGDVTIAYNIYDGQGNPVNYFYSSDTRVAATPGYAGRFNVFVVVTDTATGEQDIQNIGWNNLEGEGTQPVGSGEMTVWVTGAAIDLTQRLIQAFQQAHPEYAGWTFHVEECGESEVSVQMMSDLENGADVFIFAQDQLANMAGGGALAGLDQNCLAVAQNNDKSAVSACMYNGKMYACPVTSDNGYFLYYDKDVITNPGDLDAILADCEAAGRSFYMELNSGWYNAAFFFGAGCSLDYRYDEDGNAAFQGSVTGAAGLKAVKAMIRVAQSPAFANGSSAEYASNCAAIVSGIWDHEAISRMWDNPGAARMPMIDGMQLGSFSGNKLIGAKPQASSEKQAAAYALMAYLAGEGAQRQRQEELGWLASNPTARRLAGTTWYHNALAAQAPYARPQGQYPFYFWSVATEFADAILDGRMAQLSNGELQARLQAYQEALEGN